MSIQRLQNNEIEKIIKMLPTQQSVQYSRINKRSKRISNKITNRNIFFPKKYKYKAKDKIIEEIWDNLEFAGIQWHSVIYYFFENQNRWGYTNNMSNYEYNNRYNRIQKFLQSFQGESGFKRYLSKLTKHDIISIRHFISGMHYRV